LTLERGIALLRGEENSISKRGTVSNSFGRIALGLQQGKRKVSSEKEKTGC